MMKKTTALLLVIVLSLGMLTACGDKKEVIPGGGGDTTADAKNGNGSTDNTQEAQGTDKPSGDSMQPEGANNGITGSIYKTPGQELTDFYDALGEPEKPYDDIIKNDEAIASDMEALRIDALRLVPWGVMTYLLEFDAIEGTGDKKQGTLPMSGYEGIREKSGSEIRFSAKHEYTADEGTNKQGDKGRLQGVLDTSSNTLTFEFKTERDGKVVRRVVLEAMILPDGTCISQYLTVSKPIGLRESDQVTKAAVFKRYGKEGYSAVAATFDSDFDFTYNSIVGKTGITPEEMSKEYKVDGIITVKDGKAAFEKGK